MNLTHILHHLSTTLKPLADELAQAESLDGPAAQLRALGILLDRHSKSDQLKDRDREVLNALWRVYRRTQRPVERDKLIREMDPRLQQCDESTVYRSLKRLRDEYGFVRMIGKHWQPVFDPHEGLETIDLTIEPPLPIVRIAA